MKAYKIEIVIIDHEDRGPNEIIDIINCVDDITMSPYAVKVADIGEWTDDHPLNQSDDWNEAVAEQKWKDL